MMTKEDVMSGRDALDFGYEVERFEIPCGLSRRDCATSRISVYVTRTKSGHYRGWYNGSGIGGRSKSIVKTREHVRAFAEEWLLSELAHHRRNSSIIEAVIPPNEPLDMEAYRCPTR